MSRELTNKDVCLLPINNNRSAGEKGTQARPRELNCRGADLGPGPVRCLSPRSAYIGQFEPSLPQEANHHRLREDREPLIYGQFPYFYRMRQHLSDQIRERQRSLELRWVEPPEKSLSPTRSVIQ